MARQTWLADELRKAGLRVVEVSGWKGRGSESFSPVGITWHATAGSRSSTAQGEVNVILNGSPTAPPPIAQLMIYRDGVVYVCAAGRCNHNKVGWAGLNKGLGNTALFGIEMANDNKGEPWSPAQINAAKRATAVIMEKIGADPLRRMAGHYEHQPYVGRPAGEKSTKTDPLGVNMSAMRSAVKGLMIDQNGDDELNGDQNNKLNAVHWATAAGVPSPTEPGKRTSMHVWAGWMTGAVKALADAVGKVDENAKVTLENDFNALKAQIAESQVDPGEVAAEVLRGLGDTPVQDVAELLKGVYDAEEIAALKAAL